MMVPSAIAKLLSDRRTKRAFAQATQRIVRRACTSEKRTTTLERVVFSQAQRLKRTNGNVSLDEELLVKNVAKQICDNVVSEIGTQGDHRRMPTEHVAYGVFDTEVSVL